MYLSEKKSKKLTKKLTNSQIEIETNFLRVPNTKFAGDCIVSRDRFEQLKYVYSPEEYPIKTYTLPELIALLGESDICIERSGGFWSVEMCDFNLRTGSKKLINALYRLSLLAISKKVILC